MSKKKNWNENKKKTLNKGMKPGKTNDKKKEKEKE